MSVLFSAEPRFIRIVFNFSLTKRSEEGRTILIREDMFTFTLHNALVTLYNPSNMRLEINIEFILGVILRSQRGSAGDLVRVNFIPQLTTVIEFFPTSSVSMLDNTIFLTMQIKIFLLQCDYYNQGHLDKINQLDDRKITIHTEKGSCQS